MFQLKDTQILKSRIPYVHKNLDPTALQWAYTSHDRKRTKNVAVTFRRIFPKIFVAMTSYKVPKIVAAINYLLDVAI